MITFASARSKPFETQALVAELAVEALVGAVLPGLAWIAQRGADTGLGDPLQDGVADELGSVVRAHEQRRTVQAHQAREHLDDALLVPGGHPGEQRRPLCGLAELGGFGLSVPVEFDGYSEGGESEYIGMVVATEELSRGSLGVGGIK